jgi:acylphosphatase
VIQVNGSVKIGRPSSQAPGSPVNDRQSAKRFFVSGTVQGVGYRVFARDVGMRLGVAGYTKNLRDGRVEVYAIGSPQSLQALQRQLERGPSTASVTAVVEQDASLDANFADGFSIEHDR